MTKDGDASSGTSLPRLSSIASSRQSKANVTPTRWFSVTMGTGIVSILLHNLPYNGVWLYWISVTIFGLNVLLFSMGCIMSVLRYTLYPEIFWVMITHPVQSMFIGTFPMGLATIVNMFVFVCVPAWGEWTRYFAWGLWIFDAVISVMTALSLPFVLLVHSYVHPKHSLIMKLEWPVEVRPICRR
jgi:tellurite resistance protein TehA-like permease